MKKNQPHFRSIVFIDGVTIAKKLRKFFFLFLLFALCNMNAVLIAASLERSSNETVTYPEDSLDTAPFLNKMGSEPAACPDAWELLGAAVEDGYLAIVGVTFLMAAFHYGWGYHPPVAREVFSYIGNARERLMGAFSPTSTPIRVASPELCEIEVNDGAGMTEAIPLRDFCKNEDAYQKLIEGCGSLLKNYEEVVAFFEGSTLSLEEQLDLMLFFYSGEPVPDKKFRLLEADLQDQLLFQAKKNREKYQSISQLGLFLTDAQALQEKHNYFIALNDKKEETPSSTVHLFQNPPSEAENISSYQEVVTTGIIENEGSLNNSQKLDLIERFLNPYGDLKIRKRIASFNIAPPEEQAVLLKESQNKRIKVEELLKELPQEYREQALLNICVNPKINYQKKLDLLIALVSKEVSTEDQRSILAGKELEAYAQKYYCISNCHPLLFEKFIADIPQEELDSIAAIALKNRYITQLKNFQTSPRTVGGSEESLSYETRTGAIYMYLESEDTTVRKRILQGGIAPSSIAVSRLKAEQRERQKKNMEEDFSAIVRKAPKDDGFYMVESNNSIISNMMEKSFMSASGLREESEPAMMAEVYATDDAASEEGEFIHETDSLQCQRLNGSRDNSIQRAIMPVEFIARASMPMLLIAPYDALSSACAVASDSLAGLARKAWTPKSK